MARRKSSRTPGKEQEYAVVYVAVARFKDGSAAGSPTVTVVGQFKSETLARRAAKAVRQGPNVSVVGFPIRIR
jgi:hypothetical protein